jgi:hypothetical protein
MTYILIGISIFLLLVWCATAGLYYREKDKNKDLQLENSDLIDRNLKLQDEVSQANKDWLKLSDRLADALDKLVKKKELLEIQDRLLYENNIKY